MLSLLHDRVAVEYVAIGSLHQRMQADRGQAVMVTVSAREPVEDSDGGGMEDVAMEPPFEETEEKVRRQEGKNEGQPSGCELLRPYAGQQEPESKE